MTYSQETKGELASLPLSSKIEAFLELSAMVQLAGSLVLTSGGRLLRLVSEQEAVIQRAGRLVDFLYGKATDLLRLEKASQSRKSLYYTDLAEDLAQEIFDQAGMDFFGRPLQDRERILGRLAGERNAGAFLRGAFLAGGSLVDPKKSYHLEMVVPTETASDSLRYAFSVLSIEAKEGQRADRSLLYLKDSEAIADLLVSMGASQAMLALENVKVQKEIANHINRKANAETANLDKQYQASLAQIQAIQRIQESRGLESLSPSLVEVAKARLAHPMLNLRELGQTLRPPVGKSGVSHRMQRILALANTLEEKHGKK